nr:hypothetical protein [Rhodobacter ruber]
MSVISVLFLPGRPLQWVTSSPVSAAQSGRAERSQNSWVEAI